MSWPTQSWPPNHSLSTLSPPRHSACRKEALCRDLVRVMHVGGTLYMLLPAADGSVACPVVQARHLIFHATFRAAASVRFLMVAASRMDGSLTVYHALP